MVTVRTGSAEEMVNEVIGFRTADSRSLQGWVLSVEEEDVVVAVAEGATSEGEAIPTLTETGMTGVRLAAIGRGEMTR